MERFLKLSIARGARGKGFGVNQLMLPAASRVSAVAGVLEREE
jgi:hypothetical protein